MPEMSEIADLKDVLLRLPYAAMREVAETLRDRLAEIESRDEWSNYADALADFAQHHGTDNA